MNPEKILGQRITRRKVIPALGLAGAVLLAACNRGQTPLPPTAIPRRGPDILPVVPTITAPTIPNNRDGVGIEQMPRPASLIRVAPREVFQFLRLDALEDYVDLKNIQWDKLTTLGIFGVPVASNGELLVDSSAFSPIESAKATQILSAAHENKVRTVLTLTQLDDEIDTIASILRSTKAQKKSIDGALSLQNKYRFRGVNIDFEHFGPVPADLRTGLVDYIALFEDRLHREDNAAQLSSSIWVNAATKDSLWDLPNLNKYLDLFFIMGYGYESSSRALSAAPLYDISGNYNGSLSDSISSLLKQAPPSKLVLGLPFYGYRYVLDGGLEPLIGNPVLDYDALTFAQTTPTFRLDDANTYVRGWSDNAQTEWALGRKDDNWRLTILGRSRSLAERIKWLEAKGMRGVGGWTLDFVTEGPVPEVWGVFNAYLKQGLAGYKPDLSNIDARLDSYVPFQYKKDIRWSTAGTTEVTMASLLSMFGDKLTPDMLQAIFLDKGIRTRDLEILFRPNLINWLSNEKKMDVQEIFDIDPPGITIFNNRKTFDYDRTQQLLNQGYLTAGSGTALWDEEYPDGKEIVFGILGVNKAGSEVIITDPLNKVIRRVNISQIRDFKYAYAFKPRN